MSLLAFPDGFIWGAATSAHQVEGGNDRNDWSVFERQGKVARGEVSGIACDHYNRFAEDFRIAAALGHGAHRFSIEWSRVEPEEGRFDEEALAHYGRVLEELHQRGLKPFVTLHHFTNPLWFAAGGGWGRRDAVSRFAAYVRRVVERLGHLSEDWLTINEPASLVHLGYRAGYWPPERRQLFSAHRVSAHIADAHRVAYDIIHELRPGARVGLPVNVCALRRPSDPFEWAVRPWVRRLANDWFLDRQSGRFDMVGIQYYSRFDVRELLPWHVPGDVSSHEPGVRTDMGWEIYPPGMYETVMHAWERYRKPIVVTENGVATRDDRLRATFIRDHLVELHRAIAGGADVRGYLYWSLLDNFEWREGFAKRFGLVEVDRETLERRVRPSARLFERVCRSGQLDPAADIEAFYRPEVAPKGSPHRSGSRFPVASHSADL